MIFYFSGTGNSLHAATVLAKAQGETMVSIAKEFDKAGNPFLYTLKPGETLGIVYPIHAWGPPYLVLDFLAKLSIVGPVPYVFSIATCGEEEGDSTAIIQELLARRGVQLNAAFTLVMPNNYMIGIALDSPEVRDKLLADSERTLVQINEMITKRTLGVRMIYPGKSPKLKTKMIHPLFNRFAMSTKPFYATDACTSCGLCEAVCPIHTIQVATKPSWGKACTHCLACINRCPVQAIEYGKTTIGKGRYVHPDLL